jgi:hypothetical protein
MKMVKVEVNKVQLDHIFACLANLKTLVTKTLHKSIPEDSAREFAVQLKENIVSQKYAPSYTPLGGWKTGEPNAGKFWEWYGEALASIKYFNIDSDSWFAGFGYSGLAAGGGTGKKTKINAKTKNAPAVLHALKLQKKGVITRKAGQTTEEALAARKALIEQRVARAKSERRLDHETAVKGPPVKVYTKEEIAQYAKERVSRASEMGRSITIDKTNKYEPRKYKEEQHN